MARYKNAEIADMHLMYGRAFGNAHEVYGEAFPQRRLPDHRTFTSIDQRLRENGTFTPKTANWGLERTEHILDAETEILDIVEEEPGISVRRLSYLLLYGEHYMTKNCILTTCNGFILRNEKIYRAE
ncbi:hypothetical protein Zmor_006742 [Zophobas morio]|uniref:Uncharacterized protein n=1 Tax=Zophobas morio TaxID=2755281 RepID=A0AA38MMX9_9CUCU|nr:hypothetical protein Zmor_006742 [Zophobas morio]